jgi:hypothetical protein
MRLLALCAVSGLALTAAACTPTQPPQARARLDCPASQGELTRASAAADGRSCQYRSADGVEVELRLLPTAGDAEAALARLEAELTPLAAAAAAPSAAAKDAEAAMAQAEADAAAPDAARTAPTRIDAPGVRITTDENERAEIDLPGIHIRAEDDSARMKIGPVDIDARDDQATVRVFREVRLRGQALSRAKRGVRATFFKASGPASGQAAAYRYVGYEAGGPKAGPLTVALVKSRSAEAEALRGDVEDLVRDNGGV